MADAAITVEQSMGAPSVAHMLRQAGVLVAIAASVALGVYVVMWAKTPNYSMLYSDLSERDVSQVIDALGASNIPYRLDHQSGAIYVASSAVQDARLKLASAGLPKSAGMGFELLDGDQGFGTSQFMEHARYQRAIEGELSRSIAKIDNIRAARVHLAIPKTTVFARSRREPGASVIIDLYPGRRLEMRQVTAITHLVSSSIPELQASKVTVVDQSGNLLTDMGGDEDMVLTAKRFEHTRKLEKSYTARVEAILTPFVGLDGVRAQVTADLDFTVTEQTRESFDPDLAAVRSERVLEEERTGSTAGGIPGALSNEPPTQAISPEQTGDAQESTNTATLAGGGQPQSKRKQSTRNYELDRTISHTRPSLGTIRRLSVAVVLRAPPKDEDAAADATIDGSEEKPAFPPEQMARMTQLVKEAIGFDAARGDTVSITTTEFFAPPTPEPLPEPALWEQAWVWDIAKQSLGGLFVLFLLFGVLRPTIKSLLAKSNEASAEMLAAAQANAALALPPAAAPAPVDPNVKALLETPEFGGDIDQIKQIVNDDPKIAAQVLRGWVGTEK